MRFIFILMIMMMPHVVLAADAKAPEVTPITVLDDKTKNIMDGLDEISTRQFQKLREAYGTLRAVKDAEGALTRAVNSCAAAHKDVGDDLVDALKKWHDAIELVRTRADERLNQMIKLQTFAQTATVKDYFKAFDAAVIYRNHLITEIPITDEGDCKKLATKMDKSSKTLSGLMVEKLDLDTPLAESR